jgi:hypothetical protein
MGFRPAKTISCWKVPKIGVFWLAGLLTTRFCLLGTGFRLLTAGYFLLTTGFRLLEAKMSVENSSQAAFWIYFREISSTSRRPSLWRGRGAFHAAIRGFSRWHFARSSGRLFGIINRKNSSWPTGKFFGRGSLYFAAVMAAPRAIRARLVIFLARASSHFSNKSSACFANSPKLCASIIRPTASVAANLATSAAGGTLFEKSLRNLSIGNASAFISPA